MPRLNNNQNAAEIVYRLAGFLSLYMGIDACYLFLIRIKVIKLPQEVPESEIFATLSRFLA